MSTQSGSWLLWALLAAVFAALTAVFAKLGVQDIDADFATLLRTVLVAVLLVAFTGATGKWADPRAISPKTLAFLALSALATGASWVCYFRALKLGDISRVAPVDKLSLVLVAVFGFSFLGEHPTPTQWAGVVLVATGTVLLAVK
ncbi:MAG TPA: EamA family transporter [Rhodanobacteraceae bacterium]|nr:EamA family transporter [Rhodanobacteraceae bacterium]